MARQKFIDEHRELPPADKRDTLSVRLSDFIRDLDGYEKNLLEDVELTEFADIIARQMEQHLKEPATTWVIDCLAYSTKSRTESDETATLGDYKTSQTLSWLGSSFPPGQVLRL